MVLAWRTAHTAASISRRAWSTSPCTEYVSAHVEQLPLAHIAQSSNSIEAFKQAANVIKGLTDGSVSFSLLTAYYPLSHIYTPDRT